MDGRALVRGAASLPIGDGFSELDRDRGIDSPGPLPGLAASRLKESHGQWWSPSLFATEGETALPTGDALVAPSMRLSDAALRDSEVRNEEFPGDTRRTGEGHCKLRGRRTTMRNCESRYIVPALACAVLLVLPAAASAQQNPLTGQIRDEQLAGKYQGSNKSDNSSNVEYSITNASGTADSALGTVIQRGSDEFKLTREVSPDEATYDGIRGRQYDRHIYAASKKREIACDPTYQFDGKEIYVTVDYRRLPPKPVTPTAPPTYFEAYVAEVKQGVCKNCGREPTTKTVDTQRWEFKKVGRRN